MRTRGEIAEDDFIDARPDLPFAPPEIERLNCTTMEFNTWIDSLLDPAEFGALRDAGASPNKIVALFDRSGVGATPMNRMTETRLRKLETVIDPKDKPSLLIVACDQAKADCKLAEARKAGLEGEPTIVLTGVRCADQWGWLLATSTSTGAKFTIRGRRDLLARRLAFSVAACGREGPRSPPGSPQ